LELNKKILRYGLILIALSLILTIGTAVAFNLEDPVFLKMYIEQNVSNNENTDVIDILELKYITNTSDSRKVIDIKFEEEPNIEATVSYWHLGGGFSFFNNNNQIGDIYGRYVLHTIYLKMDLNNMDRELYEIELNNAKIRFDDGSTQDADLGRIIIYKDKSKMGDLVTVSSSGSSDGTSSSRKIVNTNIKLLHVTSPLLDELEDYFDLTIDRNDYRQISGMQYKTSNSLNTYAKFKSLEDIALKYTFYDIKPKLYYEDEEGNVSYTRIYNIHHIPYHFDLKGIFKSIFRYIV